MHLTRDTRLAGAVGLWVLLVLGLDTHATLTVQRLLGLGTWVLLLAALRGEGRATRLQVGVVVAYASVVEYVFAGWLGVYVYRLENVPAFVPPGHGLVYLAALALGRSAWAHRHATPVVTATIAVCGAWAVWGLTLSGRPDLLGALWFGCLLLFLRRGKTPLVYCGAFLVTSYLELVGTGLGTWTWSPADPTGLISIGNPPSGIAGGYCFFDAAALWLTPRLLARYGIGSGTGTRRARTTTAAITSAPPHTCTGVSRSPRATAATTTLTTGSSVDSTAVSDGPSSGSAAKNAATATTVPNTVTPPSAAHACAECGSSVRVATASTS